MQPLIDADVLRYEVGFAAETGWGGEDIPSWEYVAEMLDSRIANICAIVEATMPPILYLTGKTNFRYAIAKRQPYKVRKSNKPWHFNNLTAYIKGKYDYRQAENLEADDLMAIEQSSRQGDTIICTRDKDLRAVSGWHFGWELGNQAQYGPKIVDEYGELSYNQEKFKLSGSGLLFFYAQCLMGDVTDSIPGLQGCGPKKAYEILKDVTTSQEAFKRVLEAYRGKYGDSAEQELLEQGRLLHMTRKLHPDGSPVLWELPNG